MLGTRGRVGYYYEAMDCPYYMLRTVCIIVGWVG